MKLSGQEARIVAAMRGGATLKVHRTLDGEKLHMLHPLEGSPEAVSRAAVESLKRGGIIASNMKFPAAVYVLTEVGRAAATANAASRNESRKRDGGQDG